MRQLKIHQISDQRRSRGIGSAAGRSADQHSHNRQSQQPAPTALRQFYQQRRWGRRPVRRRTFVTSGRRFTFPMDGCGLPMLLAELPCIGLLFAAWRWYRRHGGARRKLLYELTLEKLEACPSADGAAEGISVLHRRIGDCPHLHREAIPGAGGPSDDCRNSCTIC